jgi:hypothetical protein
MHYGNVKLADIRTRETRDEYIPFIFLERDWRVRDEIVKKGQPLRRLMHPLHARHVACSIVRKLLVSSLHANHLLQWKTSCR